MGHVLRVGTGGGAAYWQEGGVITRLPDDYEVCCERCGLLQSFPMRGFHGEPSVVALLVLAGDALGATECDQLLLAREVMET